MQKETTTTPKAIDLGLPSGTLWSDRNLGAESVTDYGDYYMWGSTEPDTNNPCNLEHTPSNGGFKFFNADMLEAFRKEAFPDGVLLDQYDAANVQLGGNWHMPTQPDFEELKNNTTAVWTSLNGISGRMFTSKTNGNSIFIPASGYRDDSDVYDVGIYADLWSSTLNSDDPTSAYNLDLYSRDCYVNDSYRYYGQSVRPVQRISTT